MEMTGCLIGHASVGVTNRPSPPPPHTHSQKDTYEAFKTYSKKHFKRKVF